MADLSGTAKAVAWAREVAEHNQQRGDTKTISQQDLLLVVEAAEAGLYGGAMLRGSVAPTPYVPPPDSRDPGCVEEWPDCYSGGYDPHCCRFPKSCSC